MPKNEPNENDEIDEIDFDDIDPLPTDDTDIEESEYATTDIPPNGLIDLIADQNASEARAGIFQSLYAKVSGRINDMKADIRKGESSTPE